jgi:hypothetical protein
MKRWDVRLFVRVVVEANTARQAAEKAMELRDQLKMTGTVTASETLGESMR